MADTRAPDPRNDSRYAERGRDPNPQQQRGYDSRDPRGYDSRNDPRGQQTHSGGNAPPMPPNTPTEKRKIPRSELQIPEGSVMVECIGHSINAKGIGIRCRLTEGPHAGKDRIWYGYFTDAAMPATMRGIRALGMNTDDISDCSSMYRETGGKIALATLEHNEYEGSWSERIAWINDDGVVMKDKLEGPALKAFAAHFKGTMQQYGFRSKSTSNGSGGYAPGQDRGPAQQQQTARQPPPQQRDLEDHRRAAGQYSDPHGDGPPPEGDPWDDAPPRGR